MDYQKWLQQADDYFRKAWGIAPAFAGQVALLYLYFSAYGLNPRITSGLRSAKKQAELRARWDRGDRAGLRFKPAVNSSHTKGTAVDIVTSNPQMAGKIAAALNIGWAGMKDDVHYFKKP